MRLRCRYSLVLTIILTITAFAQQNTAWYYSRAQALIKSNPDSAIIYYSKALAGAGNKEGDTAIVCYGHLGDLYSNHSDLQKAFTNYLSMLELVEKKRDTARIITGYNSVAIVLNQQRKYDEAIRYTKMSIDLARKGNRHWQVMNGLTNLSDMLALTGKSDSSIKILNEALSIANAYHYEPDIPNVLANLGNVYYGQAEMSGDKKLFGRAASYSQQAIDLLLGMKNPEAVTDDYRKDLAYAYGLNGAAQAGLGNYTAAEAAYQKAIPFYQAQKDLFDLTYLYYELTHVYIKAGKNAKASECLAKYDSVSRIVYTTENTRAISDMQTKYETEKKEQQNQVLLAENQLTNETLKQQKLITSSIIAGLILALALAFFIFRGLRQQRAANQIISKQKEEVQLQKQLLEEKQKEILDSIHYARRIQRSLLTSEYYIRRQLTRLQDQRLQ